MKEHDQKILKKLTRLFLLHLFPFYEQNCNKKGPENSHQSLFGLQNMFRKNPFFSDQSPGKF